MANFNTNSSRFIFVDSDLNDDGIINAKDFQSCPAVDVAAEIKSLIDTDENTFPTAVNFDPSGNIVITLSNGDTITDTFTLPDIFALPGDYIPDTNGNLTIPLSDGSGNIVISGVVSPDDFDIVSFNSVAGPNGSFTVTPVLSNGETLSPFTVGENTFLTGAVLGSNGCDVIFPMSDGPTFTVSLCGLISNMATETNPDGSTTVAHVSGDGVITTFIIPVDLASRVTALEAKCIALEACVAELNNIN